MHTAKRLCVYTSKPTLILQAGGNLEERWNSVIPLLLLLLLVAEEVIVNNRIGIYEVKLKVKVNLRSVSLRFSLPHFSCSLSPLYHLSKENLLEYREGYRRVLFASVLNNACSLSFDPRAHNQP